MRLNKLATIPMDFDDTYAIVRVRMRDGRRLEERCDKPRGLWGVPLERDERLAKFTDCTEPALPKPDIERLVELIEGMDRLDSVAPIMDIARRADGAGAARP